MGFQPRIETEVSFLNMTAKFELMNVQGYSRIIYLSNFGCCIALQTQYRSQLSMQVHSKKRK